MKASASPSVLKVSILKMVCLLVLATGLAGCDLMRNQLKTDRAANLEFQDFRDGLRERVTESEKQREKEKSANASRPDLLPYVSQPREDIKPMPLVSISVNQTIPVRDVLFELAQQAGFDLELDPSIRGSLIFTATNKPFDSVIERLTRMAGLRYTLDDNVLRVEVDRPFTQVYKLDYLNYVRSNNASIRSSVAVVSGQGADSGSTFETRAESEADLWNEIEVGLRQILEVEKVFLITDKDPRITAVAANPDVAAVGAGANGIQIAAPDFVLNVVDNEEDENNNIIQQEEEREAIYSVNRQAGIITVYAPESTQKEVQNYLDIVKKAMTSQVLIEAKILEVSLNDSFNAGIDWSALDLFSGEGTLSFNSASVTNPISAFSGSTTGNTFSLGYFGNDVNALVSALSEFGTTRALASPRLTVLNNQSAVLNVATNRVFFEIDIDVTTQDNVTNTDIDSDIRNIPEGILVSVQPQINLDEQTISLAIRPTVTSVVREVPDPAIQFTAAQAGVTNVESLIPEVNVQEIDSVIKVRSGQPVVMGGLLQDRAASTEGGVPGASELPIFGSLFKSHSDRIEKTELVILLKATIIDNYNNIHQTDRDIYKNFSGDRRPFRL